MSKLVAFCSPSGGGKTTIVRRLMKNMPDLVFSVSATSRKARPKEIEGKDYHFLTQEQFEKAIANEEFIEWEEVYAGMYYGTLKREIERIISINKIPVFDVDVQGGIALKALFGNDLLGVFIAPPNMSVLELRLRARGTENEESLTKRLSKAAHEWSFQDQFDEILINDDLDEAVRTAEEILKEFLN